MDERELDLYCSYTIADPWPQDLVQRVYLDSGKKKSEYYALAGSLQQSWRQLPSAKSDKRFMKPVCVVRQIFRTYC